MLGLIGGPLLLLLSSVLIVFDVFENGSTPSGLLSLPEIAWEASLAIYRRGGGVQAKPDR